MSTVDDARTGPAPARGMRRTPAVPRGTDGSILDVTDARWLSAREAAAWKAVRDLGQPLWAALGRDLYQQCGLSMADYQVLVVLSEGGDMLPYRELAEATGWEKSRLSHQLTRMERRGLLKRVGCADDGRSAQLTLTPEGRTAIEEAAPGHVAAVRRLLIDHLSEGQMEALIAVAERTHLAIDAESAAPVRAADSGATMTAPAPAGA